MTAPLQPANAGLSSPVPNPVGEVDTVPLEAGAEGEPPDPTACILADSEHSHQLADLAELDRILTAILSERAAWAGIPLPWKDGPALILEERHPYRELLEEASARRDPEVRSRLVDELRRAATAEAARRERQQGESGQVFRQWQVGSWYSTYLAADVNVDLTSDGYYRLSPQQPWREPRWSERLRMLIRTQFTAGRFSLRAERHAERRLRSALGPEQWRSYVVTGGFIERSHRSGVLYWFRRLRPTIATTSRYPKRGMRTALCLHPVGYHSDSFTGLATPSAEVLAHLLLMRCDEPRYWRYAEQHTLDDPRSGI